MRIELGSWRAGELEKEKDTETRGRGEKARTSNGAVALVTAFFSQVPA